MAFLLVKEIVLLHSVFKTKSKAPYFSQVIFESILRCGLAFFNKKIILLQESARAELLLSQDQRYEQDEHKKGNDHLNRNAQGTILDVLQLDAKRK